MSTLLELLGAANNLDEPEPVLNKREAILGIIISFNIVSWACVIFRFYARFKIMKAPWWDDFFVLLSSVSSLCLDTWREHLLTASWCSDISDRRRWCCWLHDQPRNGEAHCAALSR